MATTKVLLVKPVENLGGEGEQVTVKKNEQVSFAKGDAFAAPEAAAEEYKWIDITNGLRGNHEDFAEKHAGNATEKTIVRFFWEEQVAAAEASELIITPDDFPGTYRVIGDTLVRSEKDGKDSKFQFVINKAKLLSEVTITMQAEGEPSTFSMTLNVLRDEDGNMMSLIKYWWYEGEKLNFSPLFLGGNSNGLYSRNGH